MERQFLINTPRRIVADLDGLQAKVNALRELQSATAEELSPPLHFGDCRSAACAIRADAEYIRQSIER